MPLEPQAKSTVSLHPTDFVDESAWMGYEELREWSERKIKTTKILTHANLRARIEHILQEADEGDWQVADRQVLERLGDCGLHRVAEVLSWRIAVLEDGDVLERFDTSDAITRGHVQEALRVVRRLGDLLCEKLRMTKVAGGAPGKLVLRVMRECRSNDILEAIRGGIPESRDESIVGAIEGLCLKRGIAQLVKDWVSSEEVKKKLEAMERAIVGLRTT